MNAAPSSLAAASPVALIEYILRRFHDPLPEQVASLSHKTKSLLTEGTAPADRLRQIDRLLHELWSELEPHLLKEERVLFPMIESVVVAKEAGQPLRPSPVQIMQGPVRVMLMEHDRADEILRALAEVTSDYQPAIGGSAQLTALYADLRRLDDELHEHIRVENELLFPAVSRL